MWESELDGDLVLADLCARCARESDRFLDLYGGRGRDTVRLTHEGFVSVVEPVRRPLRRVARVTLRGLFYILIALATFVIVTLITSRR